MKPLPTSSAKAVKRRPLFYLPATLVRLLPQPTLLATFVPPIAALRFAVQPTGAFGKPSRHRTSSTFAVRPPSKSYTNRRAANWPQSRPRPSREAAAVDELVFRPSELAWHLRRPAIDPLGSRRSLIPQTRGGSGAKKKKITSPRRRSSCNPGEPCANDHGTGRFALRGQSDGGWK